ncbi:MAG: hypothetical protein M0P33_03760 [Massilibacteroides sp.]|nr:hypothetical protein [Massilibacteroides sp.]
MNGNAIPFFGIIGVFILPAILLSIILFHYFKNRHQEKMAMIEKGITLVEPERPMRKVNRYATLEYALVMIGLGLGAFIGIWIVPYLPQQSFWNQFVFPGIIILFGGLGFLAYFFLSLRFMNKENKEKD